VSRIDVAYDAVDLPALTRRKIPLMIGGTANSVSVAEAQLFLICPCRGAENPNHPLRERVGEI
jgi:D-3-phosphoglycerate dehydrogenase